MDNFPLKRGIGISRTTHPQPQMPTFQMDLPTNTQKPLPKHFQPQMTVMSRQPQKAVDLKGQGPHSRTFSTGIQDPTQQPKVKPTDPVIRQQNFKFEPSVLVQTPQNNLPKLISFTNGPILMPLAAQEERALMNVQNMLTVNNSNRPQQPKNYFQQVLNNPSLSIKIDQKDLSQKEEESGQLGNSQKTLAIPSLTLVQHQVIPTVDNIKKSSRLSEDYINLLREKEKLNEQLRQIKQQSETWEIERQVLNDNLKEAKRQNDVLQTQRKQLQRKIEWIDHQNSSLITERQTLLKQGQSKLAKIKQLQNHLFQQDLQSKSKISAIEHQLRLMKGNKNRLQIEIDSNKKLVKSEREKNEKTLEQMNKLIFFQDDLIHAKDYNRLKDQVQYILAENARLVEEHQQYIVEVGLGRQAFNVQFKELEQQLLDLRIEYSNYRQKIENCLQAGEDKMTILKLQSQINFLRKKIEEQAELVSAKENELENAKEHIRELTAIQNDKKLQNNHFLDQISLWQIQDSVALYEQRVAALTRTVNKQQQDSNKQRKTIELLTAELRRVRQEKNITTLKQKSSENSLKSEVEILQKGHQTQIELKNKKISNLEEGLLRKAKEIGEKDKFIKEFLIGRLKLIDSASIDSIIQNIKEYFEPKSKDNSLAEPAQETVSLSQ